MLVQLKEQNSLATVILAIGYFFFDLCLATIVQIVLIFIGVVIFFLIGSDVVLLVHLLLQTIVSMIIVFKVNKFVQRRFFNRFPVTPLFLCSIAILGTICSLYPTVLVGALLTFPAG